MVGVMVTQDSFTAIQVCASPMQVKVSVASAASSFWASHYAWNRNRKIESSGWHGNGAGVFQRRALARVFIHLLGSVTSCGRIPNDRKLHFQATRRLVRLSDSMRYTW